MRVLCFYDRIVNPFPTFACMALKLRQRAHRNDRILVYVTSAYSTKAYINNGRLELIYSFTVYTFSMLTFSAGQPTAQVAAANYVATVLRMAP